MGKKKRKGHRMSMLGKGIRWGVTAVAGTVAVFAIGGKLISSAAASGLATGQASPQAIGNFGNAVVFNYTGFDPSGNNSPNLTNLFSTIFAIGGGLAILKLASMYKRSLPR